MKGKGGPVTDSTSPNADSQSDVYLDNLLEEDRATFLRSSGSPDLEADIRLIRTIITSLSKNLRADPRAFAVLFNVLCRAIGLQGKSSGGKSDIEEAILQAAEEALLELESSQAEPQS
jgi:hypothetical protein